MNFVSGLTKNLLAINRLKVIMIIPNNILITSPEIFCTIIAPTCTPNTPPHNKKADNIISTV